jgi:hypothetical protein
VIDPLTASPDAVAVDVGEYCRRVEEHLTRVNGGHLVRIVGAGFQLVRDWALAGIPFSIACRGIDQKAERHRAGRSTRPLRIEFCEPDVRAVFDQWQRAVGIAGVRAASVENGPAEKPPDETKKPSLSRHLDRIVTSLTRVAGRLDLPSDLRDRVTATIEAAVALHEQARHARGEARDAIAARLVDLDRELLVAARAAAREEALVELRTQAAGELAAYRSRLAADVWARSVDVTVDRLVRDRFGLPTLEI